MPLTINRFQKLAVQVGQTSARQLGEEALDGVQLVT
jgi:hypothetical protein